MDLTEQMAHVRDQVRQHRAENELNHLQRENLRLDTQSRVLNEQLRGERDELGNVMKALGHSSRVGMPRHRLRRLLTLTTVALGAYTLGAKAGRQRYDDIRAFVQKAMRNGRSTVGDVRERADEAIDGAQAVSGRLSDAGQVIGETAKTFAEGRADEATEGDSLSAPRQA